MADEPSDRIAFSPKKLFIKHHPDLASFRIMVGSSLCQNAIKDAIAEMAWRGASDDQLRGANTFVSILLNLSEPESPSSQIPVKGLRTL